MDAFEPIRESAYQLHCELKAKGIDTLNPSAIAHAAIGALDLEFASLPSGDPALKGARAVFDAQSGTVCCERTDEPATEALLITHEIGHARLHAGSTNCSQDDIDPSRSTEEAPVGLQRVEDYGARERRELQANVFARELLLPRTFARELYIERGMTAAQIAERTGLPKNLVRQQLFDVLLLPSKSDAPPVARRTERKPLPDPSQDKAAAHRGSPFQLQAGPGTGKTRTLVKRIHSLLDEGVDPASILVLTFSNRAAGELSERISATAPDQASRIWMGTFHAFGLDLVRRFHDRLGLSPNPPLLDRSDAIEVLEELLPILPHVHYRDLWDPARILRDVVTAISRAKDEVVTPERYRALAAAMYKAASTDEEQKDAEKCLEIARIYELYEEALRRHRAVDFGDLIMRPTLLLEQDAALRTSVQLRHRHVLVDEYQDVNRASARLLKSIAGDGKRLWVVGDARQSIYRFRGASSANMVAFGQDYSNSLTDQLTINYRSTEQIVGAFVGVARHMGASNGMLPLALTADRGPGASGAEIRRFETLEDEIGGIAASVKELEAQGTPLRDQAVLCRGNKRLNEVAAGLEARGIPVLHLGSLFERDEVRDLLALLSLVVDPFGAGLVRVGAMSRYGLTLQDVQIAASHLRSANRRGADRFIDVSKLPAISKAGVAGLVKLAADMQFEQSTSAWEVLATYLLDRSDLARAFAQTGSITDRLKAVAVWQFLNFVREQSIAGAGLPIQRTLDRVRQLVLLAEERDLRQVPAAALDLGAVRLMTVHGSKGLEFEAVHVPGLTVASFPISNHGQRCPPPVGMIEGAEGLSVSEEAKRAHDHEEECLFFVAVSRARTLLRIYLAKKQPNGNNRAASPFLDWIPARLGHEAAKPAIMPLPAGAWSDQAIEIGFPSTWRLTDSKIQLYEKCPRRFFFTHVLGLGGARKTTAFTQTHDCIYKLMRWVGEARKAGVPTLEMAEAAFNTIWQADGPTTHAYAADYRKLASRLIKVLVDAGADRQFRAMEPLSIDFPKGRVIVEPNELAELPDGKVAIRRVRTGYKRSEEYDRLDYTLYHLAGESQFGSEFLVEALHLTDATAEPVLISPQKMKNRRIKSANMVSAISLGQFPVKVDAVTCPRCPHFFVCPTVPDGRLTLS